LSYTFFLFLTGCDKTDSYQSEEVIARVDDSELTLDEVLRQAPITALGADTAEAVKRYADQWIEQQVAIQHAERIGIPDNNSFRDKLDTWYEQLLTAELKENILAEHEDDITVSDQEALSYYQQYKDQFMLGNKYIRYRHLTTNSREEAEQANRELSNGIDWELIVDRYSLNPELELRNATMYWPEELAAAEIPALNNYLRVMGITERSPIHYHGGRYHLLQLMDIKSEGESPELDWLIPQIKEWLRLEKARRIVNAYLRNLYLQAESNNEIESLDVNTIESLLNDS
jgi:hypothetical protein